jgi:hypothetical protein
VKLTVIGRYAVLAFVLWWVITQSHSAEHLVHTIGAFLTSAAHGPW